MGAAVKWCLLPADKRSGWGINATVSATRSATDEQLLHVAHQRMEQLIKEGVTLLEIKSGYGTDLPTEENIARGGSAGGREYR